MVFYGLSLINNNTGRFTVLYICAKYMQKSCSLFKTLLCCISGLSLHILSRINIRKDLAPRREKNVVAGGEGGG